MVGLTRASLATLRASLFRDLGGNAAGYLQEAGYAGGDALYRAFAEWSAARGAGAADAMSAADFQHRAQEFFREMGWGTMHIAPLHDSAMTVDSGDWAEADDGAAMQFPGCYLSAGLLADFFSRLADAQLVAMEVECRSMGAARCRFLIASGETIQHVYDGLTQGVSYEQSLATL